MKTTVEISEALLKKAKATATREGTTIRALVEEGLRKVLEERRTAGRFKLRKVSFRGEGLQAPLTDGDWDAIRDLIYEGHGG